MQTALLDRHPASPPSEETLDRRHAAEALAETGRAFHGRGWVFATSGNFSIVLQRRPTILLLTASGKDKGRLTPHDFLLVDETGSPAERTTLRPSAETALHTLLAARPGVGAVLHTHSVGATILSERFGDRGHLELAGFEMLKAFAGITTHATRLRVPIFANTQDIPALATLVAEHLDRADEPLRHGFLIRRHGLYAWGQDLDEARRHVEAFEFFFEVLLREGPA